MLQGGGALGAYQAGAYEALDEAGLLPDWVAGISIGAVNAAIIAGNPPDARVRRLRAFWEQVSSWLQGDPALEGTQSREMFNYMSAADVSTVGVPGFFEPRFPPASVMPPRLAGGAQHLQLLAPEGDARRSWSTSTYIAQKKVRLSVGAVNVRTGNFAYFNSHDMKIAPEHIMASGALPPGLPPIMIEGEALLGRRARLQHAAAVHPRLHRRRQRQVHLPGRPVQRARAPCRRTCSMWRSARRRSATPAARGSTPTASQEIANHAPRRAAPARQDAGTNAARRGLESAAAIVRCDAAVTIVHLIYRQAAYDTHAQDYEFSRFSVEEHWQAGRNDMRRTLRHRKWRQRAKPKMGVHVLDLAD